MRPSSRAALLVENAPKRPLGVVKHHPEMLIRPAPPTERDPRAPLHAEHSR